MSMSNLSLKNARDTVARVFATAFALALLSLLVAPSPSHAQSARELKDTGLVGEALDGYLGIVQNEADVDADIATAIDAINARRRQFYEADAAETRRAIDEVQTVAGAQLRERANSGDWVQNAAGEWIRKP